jgi:hypothetical protein
MPSRSFARSSWRAHEVLHLLGLIHDGNKNEGGIMCVSLNVDANEKMRTKVTPAQMKRLREATELKTYRGTADTCPQ